MLANEIYYSYFHMTPGVFRTRRALAGFDRASAAYALHMTIGVLTTLGIQRVWFSFQMKPDLTIIHSYHLI